jgi:hypothetical protein
VPWGACRSSIVIVASRGYRDVTTQVGRYPR